jgi:hypothetical protein
MMALVTAWQEEAEEVVQAAAAPGPDMNRIILLSLMILLPAVATLVVVYGGLRLKALLARIPRISTQAHLEAYRTEAALHRTLGAAIKPMLGIANALFLVDLLVFDGPISDVMYSIVPSIVCLLVSLPFRAVEARAHALPCDNDDLRRAYLDAVND